MSAMLSQSIYGLSRTMLALIAGTAILAASAIGAAESRASELTVKYDQSQILRISRPVAEIIIGNPTIADVSVQSSKLLVITGKSFGMTNMILLDNEQNVILENRIIVQREQSQIVNLHRGTGRESYNCSPRCNPTLTVGDDQVYFKRTAENSELKMKISEGGGGGGGPSGQ